MGAIFWISLRQTTHCCRRRLPTSSHDRQGIEICGWSHQEAQYSPLNTTLISSVKGMLTGPITILRWSFPRDDVPQSVQAKQLGLALRDEVSDLEKAGISVIQVDEPALREGCPLRRSEWDEYLKWAVDSFRLATASVGDVTQIHSHFCYVLSLLGERKLMIV